MSHFTVLVTKTNKISVEEQLEPYDEGIEVEPYKDEDGRTTTYNPKSKWDWYEVGGRWAGYFPLKKGAKGIRGENGVMDSYHSLEGVDIARVKDIDWKKTDTPTFAVLHNGEWYEQGEMGWWAIVTNEKSPEEWEAQFEAIIQSLDPDDEVTLVDCHI